MVLRVLGGFSALTVALTYPQIRSMSSHVGTHYDTYFTIWRLAWIAHQLRHNPAHLFDANIFYPATGTLAFSDAVLLPGILAAPPIWLGIHPVVVYNVLTLASFVACGTAMYLLVRALTGSAGAGWFAGAIFAFQPYRFAHYAQLETLLAWPIPLALLALHRLMAARGWRNGLWLGVTVAVQALSCVYYAVFLVVALIVVGLVLAWRDRERGVASLLGPLAVAALTCLALTAAYAMPYLANQRAIGTRTEDDVRQWSPTFINYLATPTTNWLYGRLTGRVGDLEGILFPGVTALLAALVALARPLRGSRAAYAALLVVAVDLSLGVHGLSYLTVYRTIGFFRALRVPARMFVIVSAAVAVLAAEGFVTILGVIGSPGRRRAAAAGLIGLVLVESASMPIGLQAVAAKPPAVYESLERQPSGVVMEWPMPRASSLGLTHEPVPIVQFDLPLAAARQRVQRFLSAVLHPPGRNSRKLPVA